VEWAIGHAIKQYARNRDIVIIGEGCNALKWLPCIEKEAVVSRRISALSEGLDASTDYLLICEDVDHDYSNRLSELGFNEIDDYYDWTKYARTNGHLPIDVAYNGVRIGYGSYFPYSKSNMKHIGGIGRFCSIANSVIIQGNHSMNRITSSSLYPMLSERSKKIVEDTPSDKDPLGTNRKVVIGNDVWIGANVLINASKCSKIGDGAVIGAGSLVMSDVPPYAVVYGSPAKIKRYRFSSELIEILLREKWWNWSRQELDDNVELLMNPDLFLEKFRRR
jgi:aminocyclitol acetyltransferase